MPTTTMWATWDTDTVAAKEQSGGNQRRNQRGANQSAADPDTVTLRVSLPKQVAQNLAALAELYHATPERMVASWAQRHVKNLMAGQTPSGGTVPQDQP